MSKLMDSSLLTSILVLVYVWERKGYVHTDVFSFKVAVAFVKIQKDSRAGL